MLFLGDDLLAYIALALGGALFAGNLAAFVRPPAGETGRGRPPIGRTVLYGGIGLIIAIWAVATLVAG